MRSQLPRYRVYRQDDSSFHPLKEATRTGQNQHIMVYTLLFHQFGKTITTLLITTRHNHIINQCFHLRRPTLMLAGPTLTRLPKAIIQTDLLTGTCLKQEESSHHCTLLSFRPLFISLRVPSKEHQENTMAEKQCQVKIEGEKPTTHSTAMLILEGKRVSNMKPVAPGVIRSRGITTGEPLITEIRYR